MDPEEEQDDAEPDADADEAGDPGAAYQQAMMQQGGGGQQPGLPMQQQGPDPAMVAQHLQDPAGGYRDAPATNKSMIAYRYHQPFIDALDRERVTVRSGRHPSTSISYPSGGANGMKEEMALAKARAEDAAWHQANPGVDDAAGAPRVSGAAKWFDRIGLVLSALAGPEQFQMALRHHRELINARENWTRQAALTHAAMLEMEQKKQADDAKHADAMRKAAGSILSGTDAMMTSLGRNTLPGGAAGAPFTAGEMGPPPPQQPAAPLTYGQLYDQVLQQKGLDPAKYPLKPELRNRIVDPVGVGAQRASARTTAEGQAKEKLAEENFPAIQDRAGKLAVTRGLAENTGPVEAARRQHELAVAQGKSDITQARQEAIRTEFAKQKAVKTPKDMDAALNSINKLYSLPPAGAIATIDQKIKEARQRPDDYLPSYMSALLEARKSMTAARQPAGAPEQ